MGGNIKTNEAYIMSQENNQYYRKASNGLEHNKTKGAEIVRETVKRKVPLKKETQETIIGREKNKDSLKITSMAEMKVNTEGQLVLPKNIVETPYLKAAIIGLGGKVDKEGQLVLDNAMKYKDQLGKIRKAGEYLEFLYKNTDLTSKVNKFEELLQTSQEYIQGRKLILMDYIKNIAKQIEQEGFLIQKTDTGYIVKNIKTGVNSKGNGKRLIDICNKNSANRYLDFAILHSIISGGEAFLGKEKFSQKNIINKLLTKYAPGKIKGNNIENILEPGKLQPLIQELEKKLKINKNNLQNVKELNYLLSIVKEAKKGETNIKGVLKENETIYKDLQEFKEYEKIQKGLIDLGKGLKDYDASKPLSEKNIGEIIKNEAFKALPIALLASILLFFTGNKKIAGGILLATFGGILGGGIVSRLSKNGIVSKPESINIKSASSFGVPTELVSTNEKTQDLYTRLLERNEQNHKEQSDALPEVSNGFVMAQILKECENPKNKAQINKIKLEDGKFEYPRIKEIILGKGGKSKNFTLNGYKGKITDKDVDAFVKLMLQEKEIEDKTFADLFEKGVDILNRPYQNISFTKVDKINTSINKKLKAKWDKGGAKEKKEVLEIQKAITKELSDVNTAWDGFKTFWTNAYQKTIGDDKIKEYKSFDISSQIQNAINKIETIDKSISVEIGKDLEGYKKYIELEEKLAPFEGIIDSNTVDFEKGLYSIAGIFSNGTELKGDAELNSFVTKQIKEFEKINSSIPNTPEYKDIKERADKILKRLQSEKEILDKKLGLEGVQLTSSDIEKDINSNKNFAEHLKQVDDAYKIYDKFDKMSPNDIELSDLENNFKELKKAKDILKEYESAYQNISINNGALQKNGVEIIKKDDFNAETTVTEIKTRINNYNTIKNNVKTKLETPLKEFYEKNKKELDDLNKINNTSKYEDDIKQLKATREYLAKNGLALSTNEDELRKQLIQTIETNKRLLENQIARATTTSTPTSTATISNKQAVIKAYNDTLSWLKDTGNFIGTALSKADDKFSDYVTQVSTALGNINADSATTATKNAIESAQSIFKNKNKDEQAEKALKAGQDIFGTNFLISSNPSQNTLNTILDKYKDAQKTLETKINNVLNTIQQNLGSITTKQNIKDTYKKLEEIKKLFPNKKATIENIEKILTKKLLLVDIKNFETEINTLSLNNNKKKVLEEFLKGNISYQSKDYSNMTISDFYQMVKNNELKFKIGSNDITIKINDIKPIFTSGAIFNALKNL